jgi:hypothetical protein
MAVFETPLNCVDTFLQSNLNEPTDNSSPDPKNRTQYRQLSDSLRVPLTEIGIGTSIDWAIGTLAPI